jgi:hypothetical protein
MRASPSKASISAEGPAVEWRRLHGHQDEVRREQRRTHKAGHPWRSVDNDVIDAARKLWRLAMQRVARQADDAEQPGEVFASALL